MSVPSAVHSDVAAQRSSEQARAKMLRRFVPVIGGVVLSICLAVLACWALSGAPFQAAWPSIFVMKPNTAICMCLLAAALLGLDRHGNAGRWLAIISASAALVLMSLILLQHLRGRNLGIDQILFTDHAPVLFPGRSSPVSCVAFSLLSISYLLIAFRQSIRAAQVLCFFSIAAPLAGFGGHLYSEPGFVSATTLPIIAFHTTACQLLLALGGFLIRPDQGLMVLIVSESLAGSTSRKLIPLAMLLPISAGTIVALMQRLSLVNASFGSALLVVCCAMLFTVGVWQTTMLLWRTEKKEALAQTQRDAAQRELDAGERRYRTLFNSIDQGFCTIELIFSPQGVPVDFRYVEVNRAFERQSGIRDAIGRRVREFVPNHEPFWFETYGRVIETGESVRFEHRSEALGRWFEVHALRVDAPELNRVACIFSDITDRKTAEAERERLFTIEQAARAEAEAAGRMKDEFLATLSHELRTPLNAIVGWTHLLKSRGDNDLSIAEGLAVIDRNARAQAQIIEDILDMSRIISGKLRLDVQRVNLSALVQAGLDTVRPAAEAKAIELQVLLDPSATQISGDANRLHQVFWNLLSNAVKFTPKGGRVQVSLQRATNHVEINVTDTGEGIDPDFLPHVFDRFRQADASTTRRHGGLGLGLAIVKQLIELHGGSVRVKSDGLGQGSTFTVQLPTTVMALNLAQPEPAAEHPTAHAPLDARPISGEQLAGVTVLIVDDETDARELLKLTLEASGASVRTAGSTAEALRAMQAEAPRVLISDIGMPVQDGYELIRQVRTLPVSGGGQVQAVALTAYARTVDRIRALEAGFQMHLSKPVEPVELVVTVASLARASTSTVRI